MTKHIIGIVLACFLTLSAAYASSCDQALPTNDSNFCPSFKSVAICHCTSTGLPNGFCQDMNKLYSRMIFLYGTVEHACEVQKNTDKQICIDDWQCYRSGGKDSQGRLCSSTGLHC